MTAAGFRTLGENGMDSIGPDEATNLAEGCVGGIAVGLGRVIVGIGRRSSGDGIKFSAK